MKSALFVFILFLLSHSSEASVFRLICGELDFNARPYHSFVVVFDDQAKRAALGAWYDTSVVMRSGIDHATQVPVAVSANLTDFHYRTPLGTLNSLKIEWKNVVNGLLASATINQLSADAWKGLVTIGTDKTVDKFIVGCSYFPTGIPLN